MRSINFIKNINFSSHFYKGTKVFNNLLEISRVQTRQELNIKFIEPILVTIGHFGSNNLKIGL